MNGIARHAKDLLNAGSSAIFLPDEGSHAYRAIVALGDNAEPIKAAAVEVGRGIIGSLLQSGQPEFINDTRADPRVVQIPGTAQRDKERLMVVPLMAGKEVQGAMAVWRQGGEPFTARELEFLVGRRRDDRVLDLPGRVQRVPVHAPAAGRQPLIPRVGRGRQGPPHPSHGVRAARTCGRCSATG